MVCRVRSGHLTCVLGVCGVGSTGVVGCGKFAVNLQPVCESLSVPSKHFSFSSRHWEMIRCFRGTSPAFLSIEIVSGDLETVGMHQLCGVCREGVGMAGCVARRLPAYCSCVRPGGT